MEKVKRHSWRLFALVAALILSSMIAVPVIWCRAAGVERCMRTKSLKWKACW